MEHWHPNPAFYYQEGGGPILDMGPYYLTLLAHLLGPVRRVMAMTTIGNPTRLITADGPNKNTRFSVGTATTGTALLEFASGALITLVMSWDVWAHSHPNLELYGETGTLRLPDPDTYGGDVLLREADGPWQTFVSDTHPLGAINWPYDAPRIANYRATAIAEMASAIAAGYAPKASGANALHVLDVLEAIIASGRTGEPRMITSDYEQTAPLTDPEIMALMA